MTVYVTDRHEYLVSRDEIGAAWREIMGPDYPAMALVEVKGLVRSRVGDPTPQRGGKRKKHYEITPSGTRALRDAYELMKRMTKGIEPLLDKAR